VNFFYIILGCSLTILGIGIIYDPIFHDTKHNYIYDFSEIKWPFGIFLTLLGIGFLYFSLRKRSKASNSDFLICPTCLKPFESKNIDEERCTTCGIDLENLKGFYERHPELRK